jgi:hypothetical protein
MTGSQRAPFGKDPLVARERRLVDVCANRLLGDSRSPGIAFD